MVRKVVEVGIGHNKLRESNPSLEALCRNTSNTKRVNTRNGSGIKSLFTVTANIRLRSTSPKTTDRELETPPQSIAAPFQFTI